MHYSMRRSEGENEDALSVLARVFCLCELFRYLPIRAVDHIGGVIPQPSFLKKEVCDGIAMSLQDGFGGSATGAV